MNPMQNVEIEPRNDVKSRRIFRFLPKTYVEVYFHKGLKTWAAEAFWDMDEFGTFSGHASTLDVGGRRYLKKRLVIKHLRMAILKRDPMLRKIHNRVRGEVKLPGFDYSKAEKAVSAFMAAHPEASRT